MNNKLNNKDIYALGGIILLSAGLMIACVCRGVVYGSTMDWSSQHYPIPEYFRTLFYSTHDPFPSYAANLGAGESIYSLSYYGLYSPIILLSYLLPFVPMGYYMMMSGVLTVFVSECLFYFLLRKSFCIRVTAFAAALFAFSMPLIYQSHRHIMFISYMPFLLLSMHLTDKYFSGGRRYPLVISAFLMIMCNYFFAVTALFALSAYGLVKCIDKGGRLGAIIKRFIPFVCLLFVSVLMSGVLLLPTAYALISGRDEGNVALALTEFLPNMRLDWLTYYSYSMGLTGFGVYAMIYALLYAKGSRRFAAGLTLLFAFCPLLVFILNGTLYFDAKVLFAFLPLALTVVAWFADDVLQHGAQKALLPLAVFLIGSVIAFAVRGPVISMILYLVDAAVTAVIILVLRKRHSIYICSLFLLIAFIGCIAKSSHDEMLKASEYAHTTNESINVLVDEASSGELTRTAVTFDRVDTPNKVYGIGHYRDTIYSSLHSKDFNRFYFEEIFNENEYRNSALTTCSQNILYNCYIGNGYFVSDKPLDMSGLELVSEKGGFYLYKNPNAYPLIYSTDKLMSRREYDLLDYPASVEALMRYTVVDDDLPDSGFVPGFERVEVGSLFNIGDILSEGDSFSMDSDGTAHITLKDLSFKFKAKLPDSCKGKLILIRFHIDNPRTLDVTAERKENDDTIIINGIKNKVSDPIWKYHNNNNSFEYVLSDLSNELEIEMRGGNFIISEPEIYTCDPEELTHMSEGIVPFEFDKSATKGDKVKGRITAESDGLLASSFVYLDGLTVKIDGSEVPVQRIDTAFWGVPITKGSHEVEVTFRAPWLGAGQAAGAAGLLILAVIIILDIRKKT